MGGERGKMTVRPVLAYLAVWALSVGAFWILMSGADAMGYAIVFIWVLNPVAMFAISFLIGKGGAWNNRVWAMPVLLGALYMFLPYVTFSLANTLSSGNVNMPDAEMFLYGAMVSAAGLCLGRLVCTLARRVGPCGKEKAAQ